jgi:fatty-acyl-CoA synthase
MLGYYGDPEATRAVLRDGWLRSGDMGLLRDDGYLTFLGRYKDMLKVGGENVAPAEIESFLGEIEQVMEVAVVGVPDTRLHEVAAAFVVLREGTTLTLEHLQAHCRGKIASFKIPRHVFPVDSLPMTPTGKVSKPELRQRALQALETHGTEING